jgi:osmotically-inducible protein OsmY
MNGAARAWSGSGLPGCKGVAMREKERVPGRGPRGSEGDEAILHELRQTLAADPALAGCGIWSDANRDRARTQILSPEGLEGRISLEVNEGIAVLEGEVPSLCHKRLVGVLAHRVPGCRDVVNRLGVVPEEEDSDEQLERAVRLALSRNPGVEVRAVRIRVANAVVTLEGAVHSPHAADTAERDTRHVLGVRRVDNRLVVEPPVRGRA